MTVIPDRTRTFPALPVTSSLLPVFVAGDAATLMRTWPEQSIDFCMTSPPYWGHRQYSGGGIGLEVDYKEFFPRRSLAPFSLLRARD